MTDHPELLRRGLESDAVPTLTLGEFSITPDEACDIIGKAVANGTIGPACQMLPDNPVCKLIAKGAKDVCAWCTDGDIGHAIACIGLAIALIK